MSAIGRISVQGRRVELAGLDAQPAALELDGDARAKWRAWGERYRGARGSTAPGLLLDLGREMFGWFDGAAGWASRWSGAGGARRLEVAAQAKPTADERALLALPWELLADASGHLAADPVQLFQVWRRLGASGAAAAPEHRDLSLLFMAASPRDGGPELDYEAEEAAILASTARLGLGVAVEESGCLDFLRERLDAGEALEALHLSCHGDHLDAEMARRFAAEGALEGPTLLLETPEGTRAFAGPGRLAEVWGDRPPRLVFLSACRTAEGPAGAAESFVRTLVR